jgi:hypothetical protein
MRQIDDARRSFCAMSSDNRYVITAECDMFGGLATRFSSVGAKKQTPPRICVWDVSTGKLKRTIPCRGAVRALSVANNTIACIIGTPSQSSLDEPAMVFGEAVVFRFDTDAPAIETTL